MVWVTDGVNLRDGIRDIRCTATGAVRGCRDRQRVQWRGIWTLVSPRQLSLVASFLSSFALQVCEKRQLTMGVIVFRHRPSSAKPHFVAFYLTFDRLYPTQYRNVVQGWTRAQKYDIAWRGGGGGGRAGIGSSDLPSAP